MSEENSMHAEEQTAFLPALTLQELACGLRERGVDAHILGDAACRVRGMAIDSRTVKIGNLFVCKGAAFRVAFLEGALASGAAAYLCEGSGSELDIPSGLRAASSSAPAIIVSDVRRAMAIVAPMIYGNPEKDLHIIGITGTKGKSTVAYMLRSILMAGGVDSSILGSIVTDDGSVHEESRNTTPESPDLWRHLSNTVRAGRKYMVMEASSQGLKYDRVFGLPFEVACFLNIGRDHISGVEHSDFEDYFSSKLRIFEQCSTAVVNARTEYADRVMAAAKRAERIVLFGVEYDGGDSIVCELPLDYRAVHVVSTSRGSEFDVCDYQAGATEHIELGMPGLFNVDNALAAIAMARLLGIGYEAIRAGLEQIRVPGRMEVVSSKDGKVLAIVDYAHNELSFEALFKSVEAEYPNRRVIALFGAPGGKAHERREALPRVAAAYADHIVYTEEDPAHDRVEDICAELALNTPADVSHEVILDREQAVERTLKKALGGGSPSVVLLLAKGDEGTMHRGDDYPVVKSDLSIAREVLLS